MIKKLDGTIIDEIHIEDMIKGANDLLQSWEPKSITVDDYNGYIGYAPQYVVDAMNLTFGIHKWGFEELLTETVKTESKDGKQMLLAVSKVSAWVIDKENQRAAWGQSNVTKGNVGDAKKGAQTDALKKALSYFSIGNKAYRGQLQK